MYATQHSSHRVVSADTFALEISPNGGELSKTYVTNMHEKADYTLVRPER